MADLITLERASENATLAALRSSNSPYLISLISAASAAIRAYCHLDITQQTYSEVYSGGVYVREPIKLRQYPVSRIDRISIGIRCMQIINSGVTAQRALVETVDDGSGNCASVKLTTVSSGTKATQTIDCTTNTTVAAVANAITANSGWSTSIYSGAAGSYNNFPSADLRTIAGSFSAMAGGAYLEIWEDWYGWTTLAFWPDEPENYGSISPFWRLDNEDGTVWGHFPRGQLNLRIGYTAGYATVPEDVQEACTQLVLYLYQQGLVNQAIKESRLGPSTEVLNDSKRWPAHVLRLLDNYVALSKVMFRN